MQLPLCRCHRQFVRYVEGIPVDFERHSYEFVSAAAASLAGLGSIGPDQPPIIRLKCETNHLTGTQDEHFDPNPCKQLDGVKEEQGTMKRKRSWRLSPTKRVKTCTSLKSAVKEEQLDAILGTSGDSTEYPLHRVLVHYIGQCDAEVLPPAYKRMGR